MASVGRGIVDDAQLFSLTQGADIQIGETAVELATLLVGDAALERIDMVVEIHAQASSSAWEYTLADSQAEADAATDDKWWPVSAVYTEIIPVNGAHLKVYARAGAATDIKWKAFGFKRSTRPATLTA